MTAALVAGFLNVAASLPDHPRAFATLSTLFAPLALSVASFLLVALVLFVVLGLPLRRVGVAPGVAATALAAAVVLLGVLLPVLEGIGRELSAAHVPALWGIAGGAVAAVAVLAALVASRAGARSEALGRVATLGAALVAVETLAAVWLTGYSTTVAGCMWLRLFVGTAWLAAGVGGGWLLWRRRICPFTGMVVLLALTLASPLAGVLSSASPPAPTARAELPAGRPRHVVLFTVDTLRPDMIGGGAGAAPTPAIDSLLADSVVFTQARSAAPWTKPSVASILTGLSPLVHGTTSRRRRLPEEVHTLAEHMRDAGYVTVGVGLNVHLERAYHFSQGFDEYLFPAGDDYGISVGARILQAIDGDRYPELFPTTTAIADRALDRLASLGDRPFFLWVHVLDPHWPYEPPAAYAPAPDPASRIGGRWGEHEVVTNVQAGNIKLGAADRERVRGLYRGEIEYVDANIARLLDFLRQAGLYDDALIAFTSDHGEEFWEHGRFEHGHTMFDEVLRVPLAIKLPGARLRRTIDVMVSNESLTPTLLELVGHANTKNPFTSPSLAGWCDEAAPDPEPTPLFSAGTYYHGDQQAVIFDGRKVIVDLETGGVQLFDLRSDFKERQSVDSLHPEDVKRASELLRARATEAKRLREEMGLEDEDVAVGAEMDRLLRGLGYAGGHQDE